MLRFVEVDEKYFQRPAAQRGGQTRQRHRRKLHAAAEHGEVRRRRPGRDQFHFLSFRSVITIHFRGEKRNHRDRITGHRHANLFELRLSTACEDRRGEQEASHGDRQFSQHVARRHCGSFDA